MIKTPEGIRRVVKKRNSTMDLLMIFNIVTVLLLSLLFMFTFGVGIEIELFFFSYGGAFIPLILILQFFFLQRIAGVFLLMGFHMASTQLRENEPDEKFGKYTSREILEIVAEQCNKMDVTSVKKIFVIESRYVNALTTDIILFKPFRYSVIVIFSNAFDILNKKELRSLVGHEVAHVKNKDSWYNTMVGNPTLMMVFVIFNSINFLPYGSGVNFEGLLFILILLLLFYILLRPMVSRMMRYQEYYADFTSATVNGLISEINLLIKLGQRYDTMIAFQQEFQRRFRLDSKLENSPEFYKKLYDELEEVIDPDEAIEVARRVVKEHGGEEIIYSIEKHQDYELFKPKIIDWRDYDTIIKNYNLEYEEIEQLVRDLKDAPHAKLFRHASVGWFKSLFQRHPRIRERIIFLWDSQKDQLKMRELTLKTEDVTEAEIADVVEKKVICPICQTKFKVLLVERSNPELKCPGCGVSGFVKYEGKQKISN